MIDMLIGMVDGIKSVFDPSPSIQMQEFAKLVNENQLDLTKAQVTMLVAAGYFHFVRDGKHVWEHQTDINQNWPDYHAWHVEVMKARSAN